MPAVDGPWSTEASAPVERASPALGAMPGRRPVLAGLARTLLTSTGVVVVYFLLPLDRTFAAGTVVTLVVGLLGVTLLIVWQVRWIVRSPHPALRAVEAVALSLPLFLLLFAAGYQGLSASDEGAFTGPLSRVDSLYFVITAFATVGFDDISPMSQLAHVLVTIQMVGDLLLIGLVLRVFVAAVDRRRHRTGPGGQDGPAPPATPRG